MTHVFTCICSVSIFSREFEGYLYLNASYLKEIAFEKTGAAILLQLCNSKRLPTHRDTLYIYYKNEYSTQ